MLKKIKTECSFVSKMTSMSFGDCSLLFVRGGESDTTNNPYVVVFCGKDSDAGHHDGLPTHRVTLEAVNAAISKASGGTNYVFLSMKAGLDTGTKKRCDQEEQYYLINRTSNMIMAWKRFGYFFGVDDANTTFKLFSYGAACSLMVHRSFQSSHIEIYGSGRTFEEDLCAVNTDLVRVFKSTGDQWCPYGKTDDDEPDEPEPGKTKEAPMYMRVTLDDYATRSRDSNCFLFIQPGRKKLCEQQQFDKLNMTHSKIGGSFMINNN